MSETIPMSEIRTGYAVKVENISKLYDLHYRNSNFRESISNAIQSVFRKNGGKEDTIWALKNISFELKQGEILGIIGKNGAGKSTLLKILSEITEPTEGTVIFNGTVASILDIGTGFHEELTGRENIFLRGTMLGRTRQQIRSRSDEIVKFSGIGKFIDTPVKHYSSGMFIRLAFSVATHFDADILLLDEVLAVGDSEFSIKSFNKIKDLVKEGKTIIIASHNLGSITNLCTQCILLEKGKAKAYGSPTELVGNYMEETIYELIGEENEKKSKDDEYLEQLQKELREMERVVQEKEAALRNSSSYEQRLENELVLARTELEKKTLEEERMLKLEDDRKEKMKNITHSLTWDNPTQCPGNEFVRIKKIAVRGAAKDAMSEIDMSDEIVFELDYWKYQSEPFNISYVIKYQLDNLALSVSTIIADGVEEINSKETLGFFQTACSFPSYFFNQGIFTLDVYIANLDNSLVFSADNLLNFRVNLSKPKNGIGYQGKFVGPLYPKMHWKVNKVEL